MREEKPKKILEELMPAGSEEISEKVLSIDRISRTVAGGRRIRFRAIIAIGNRNGEIAIASAKSTDVQGAIAKARQRAKKNLYRIPLEKGTIPHIVQAKYASARVLLKPAPEGHSIIAGGAIRSVLDLAGIKNIVSKSLGSGNALNNAMATFRALKQLKK